MEDFDTMLVICIMVMGFGVVLFVPNPVRPEEIPLKKESRISRSEKKILDKESRISKSFFELPKFSLHKPSEDTPPPLEMDPTNVSNFKDLVEMNEDNSESIKELRRLIPNVDNANFSPNLNLAVKGYHQPYTVLQDPANFVSVSASIVYTPHKINQFENCISLMFIHGVKRLVALDVLQDGGFEQKLWTLTKSLHSEFRNDPNIAFFDVHMNDHENFTVHQGDILLELFDDQIRMHIHCSAGLGRSGSVLLLFFVYMKTQKDGLNIYDKTIYTTLIKMKDEFEKFYCTEAANELFDITKLELIWKRMSVIVASIAFHEMKKQGTKQQKEIFVRNETGHKKYVLTYDPQLDNNDKSFYSSNKYIEQAKTEEFTKYLKEARKLQTQKSELRQSRKFKKYAGLTGIGGVKKHDVDKNTNNHNVIF